MTRWNLRDRLRAWLTRADASSSAGSESPPDDTASAIEAGSSPRPSEPRSAPDGDADAATPVPSARPDDPTRPAPDVASDLHTRVADDLIHTLASSRFEARLAAAVRLGEGPALDPPARVALERALDDAAAEVSIAALEALGRHDIAPSLERVRHVLRDPQRFYSALTRVRALELLWGGLPSDAVFEDLRRHLSDRDADVSAAAIRGLTSLGGARAIALLRGVFEQRGFYLPQNRLAALRALADLGMSATELSDLAAADPDPSVRAFSG